MKTPNSALTRDGAVGQQHRTKTIKGIAMRSLIIRFFILLGFLLTRLRVRGGLLTGALPATLVVLLALLGTGRAVGADWAANYGTAGAYAYTQATAVDTTGNVYIAGYFTGATFTLGGVSLYRIGSQDAFVAKLDASGTVIWAKNFGGAGALANVNSIAVDASGTIYLGGSFNGAGLTTPALTKIGGSDAFVLKLDSSGNTAWAKHYGGSGASAFGNSIAVDTSGNVYLGGFFQSANLTTPALTKIGGWDAFALKLDSSGNTTWAKNYGGAGALANVNSIAVDTSGTVYLGGYFNGASLTTPALTAIGFTDAFALKLDASGNTTWAKNYGGAGAYAYAYSIAVDTSGTIYLGGSFQNALTTPALTAIGAFDAFALKLDPSGNTAWAKNFGGALASVFAYSIAVDTSGNVYLGGSNNSRLTTPALAPIGGQHAFALKLDSSGNTTWAKNFGGAGALAYAYSIAVDTSGTVYLGGYFNGALTTPVLTAIGSQDALILKLTAAYVPDAPTIGTATTGNTQATVTFTAPGSTGGSAITGYTVTSSPAGGTDSNAGTTGLSHVITGLTNGTAYTFTVTATNANGTGMASAASSSVTPKGSQTISFGAAPSVVVGGTGTVSATGGISGNPVTFSSTTTSICNVSGSTVTGVTAGTCTIAADQAGNANYNAAIRVMQSITIGKANQSVSFGVAPTVVVGGTGTVSATATSALAVSLSSTSPSICAISGSTVTGIAAGTCTIAADQVGNANYNAAAQVVQNITISKVNQSVSFGTAPTVVVGGTGIVSATATSALAATLSSTSPSICTISGSTVTGVTAGTCTIAANQAGNANYNAATQVTQNITVGKANQSVSFGVAPTVVVGGTGIVSATATSALAVSLSSTSPSICAISGSTVTGIAAGTCTIAADQVGNANYNAATQVVQNITISKVNQSVSFGVSPTVVVGGTGIVSATATSGLAASLSSTSPSICTISGSTVTGVTAGTCTIAADQTGNANYNAAIQVTQNITVGKGSQTIGAISFSPTTLAVGGTTMASATATSGLAVTYTSTTTGVCTITGSTITGVAAGICTIAANQAGNANYNAAAQVVQNITVGKANQSVSFGTAPTVVVGGTGIVSATATSALAVSLSSTSPSICTISGSTVTGVTSGTCTIAANQAGNANYNAATQVTQNITIGKASQTVGAISFSPTTLAVGGTTTASATATSGLTVTYSSNTTGVCTISGSIITGVTAGTCTIAADQTGNANYNAATQVTQNITVGKGSQTIGAISFSPTTLAVGGTTMASAVATSGLAVTYTSTTPTICTVSGKIVTGVAVGTCTIAANQAGNANYSAATQVTQNITVGQAGQTIAFDVAPSVVVGGTGTVSATGGASGNAVTFTVPVTTGVCTISGSTVTGVTAGTCTVAANQAGNANYNAAAQVVQNITIGKANQSVSFGVSPTVVVGGTGIVSATATSALAVSYTSTTASVCTASGSIVTGVSAGICTIAANQTGNANYNAAPQVTQNITIGKAGQTIGAITFAPATLAVGGTTTASATGGASTLAVTFSTASSACTATGINGKTITGIAAGACILTANQAGNASYNAAPLRAQTLTVGAAPAPVVSLNRTALIFAARNLAKPSPVQAVILTNTGGSILNLTGIVASGDFARTTTCVATLAAGASCTISVTFTATAMGARAGLVTLTSNAAGSPHHITLTGTGKGTRYDFNGDGKSDILWRHTASGTNQIWLMNGSTLISSTLVSPVMVAPWTVAGTGDFNGDGKADILWRNTATSLNQIWLMNGAVKTSAINTTALAIAWTVAGVADFNADGKTDILWRNAATGQDAVWLMNGAAVIAGSGATGTLAAPWSIAGTGDFNGDGKSDILWRNPTNGLDSIWFMNGKAAAGATTNAAATVWSVAGVADFNGDGKADITWRYPATGATSLWLMNGAARSAAATLTPAMPATWSVAK